MICLQCGENEAQKGSDLCVKCLRENDNNRQRHIQLVGLGHTDHCASRIVWGDGECECDLYEKGYDPYAWTSTGRVCLLPE